MDLSDKIKRLLKLGLFVGAGTAAALISACKGDTTPQPDLGPSDAGKADQTVTDSQPLDRGKADGSLDQAPQPDTGKPAKMDTRGWDIPLE